VTCNADHRVASLALENIPISGPYPTDLRSLSEMNSLLLSGNSFTGSIPNDLCTSNPYIAGDETNCPNDLGTSGCCDAVRLTSPSDYLDGLVSSQFGSSDCGTLGSADANVCTFMKNKGSHDVFLTYPDGFPYLNWLKVSCDINCVSMQYLCAEHVECILTSLLYFLI
jgi:hypothetical protein